MAGSWPPLMASFLAASLEACGVGRVLVAPHRDRPFILHGWSLHCVLFLCDQICKQGVLPSIASFLYVRVHPARRCMGTDAWEMCGAGTVGP